MPWKKKIFAIAVVLLLFLGDYLYWTVPISLEKKLPEEVFDSMDMQLFYYDQYFVQKEIPVDGASLQAALDAVAQTEVTRRPKFGTMSQSFFYLYFHYPDGYTRVMVEENGELIVTPDHLKDKNLYFDGGEELYQALMEVS